MSRFIVAYKLKKLKAVGNGKSKDLIASSFLRNSIMSSLHVNLWSSPYQQHPNICYNPKRIKVYIDDEGSTQQPEEQETSSPLEL